MKSKVVYTMGNAHVLVTGAGSGIGKSTAIALAEAGAKVALLSRSKDELEEVVEKIGGIQSGHLVLTADVSKEEEMEGVFLEIESEWGTLDGVVANAGVNGVWAPIHEIATEEWKSTVDINLTGTFLTVKLALPLLKESKGAVVIVSSVNGNRMFSNSGATAYACSKAAQVAFSRMTALEFATHGVRVNCVCPGAITTKIDDSTEKRDTEDLHLPVEFPDGQVPLNDGESGSPEQVADSILYLLSDAGSHVSGSEIYVDGAQSLFQG
ncbi:SDR family oxidoreductase [Luteolibacter sp. AS25]|uniref:SDR family oxidoreductase n=1 Tax=Luteolibacter sp. AS25 TaxID=3135776 RepID=UPI00398B657A